MDNRKKVIIIIIIIIVLIALFTVFGLGLFNSKNGPHLNLFSQIQYKVPSKFEKDEDYSYSRYYRYRENDVSCSLSFHVDEKDYYDNLEEWFKDQIRFNLNDEIGKLEEIDLRETHNQLEVPVYFFEGAYDINAPLYIAEDYYEMLECPKKEWVLFEHSGHSPWKNEKSKFVEETIRVFSDGCE